MKKFSHTRPRMDDGGTTSIEMVNIAQEDDPTFNHQALERHPSSNSETTHLFMTPNHNVPVMSASDMGQPYITREYVIQHGSDTSQCKPIHYYIRI